MTLANLNRDANPLRLGGRMQPLFWERCRPTLFEMRHFRFWLLCICGFVVINVQLFDAVKLMLLAPFIPILLDLIRWSIRWQEEKKYPLILWFLKAPFLNFWGLYIVVPLLAFRVGPPVWLGAVIGIIAWRVVRLARKIREHYLDYALEHNGVTVETREKWAAFRERMRRDTAPIPSPTNTTLSWDQRDRYRFAAEALQQAWIQDALLIAGAVLGGLWSMHGVASFQSTLFATPGQILGLSVGVVGMPVLALIWQAMSRDRWPAEMAATWHAVYVWCHSPPTVSLGARAPWSARSRFGDAENRRAYLVWQLLLIGMLLMSGAIAYPWVGSADLGRSLQPYPVAGSAMFVRYQTLGAASNRPPWLRSLYFFGGIAVVPLFVGSCLTTLVGPAALSCQELFDNDGALEQTGSG